MKQLSSAMVKDGSGSVKLLPEDSEDMWHTYNLVMVGDRLRATTIRKVQRQSATGSSEAERVRLTLTIEVEDVDFDSLGCQMRVNGRNVVENDHVKIGAYHSIDLELQRAFTLEKKLWDAVFLERIREATDPASTADVAAVVMEDGLAHICLVTKAMTIVRAKVEVNIPRKGQNAMFNRDKQLGKFFDSLLRAMLQHLNFDILRVILVASPGFVNHSFYKFIQDEASRKGHREILENKGKFVLTHASSGHKHALEEVLSNPALQTRLEDTKAVQETKVLDEFFDTLNNDPNRAVYGPNHVFYSNSMAAVKTLLVTDTLFRNADVKQRRRYVALVEDVQSTGGKVHIFSSMHVSGEQLAGMTGVAALLRFPLPEIDEMDLEAEIAFDDEEAT